MKKTIILSFLTLVSIFLFSQNNGGPDTYGYTWKNSNYSTNPPTYSWFDITSIGTQVTGLADDNVVGPFTASSGFQFYWYPTPQFWIGSNGYITFDGDNIASPFPDVIPNSAGANNFIAPMLADLNFSGTGNTGTCYYYSNSDTLCVSYHNLPFFYNNSTTPYTGSCTFQVILNKADKSITFNYQSMNLGSVTSLSNAVGIENVSGTIGLQNYLDVLPSNNFTIKYYYPSTVTYAVTDAGMNWNGNDKTGGIFIKKGAPHVLQANVKNYGNQNLGSFSVKDTVYNSNWVSVTTGTASVNPIAVQQDTQVTFTNTFTPTSAGNYSFNTGVSGLSGDMVADNNLLQQELIAIDTSYSTVTLDYSDGVGEGDLGWNGGNGGIAVYIEPPSYPAKIVSSRFNIASNATTPVGFYAIIYDDDGVNGGAGTVLDSVYVPPSSITLDVYTVVQTASSNLVINDGGVYLLWLMEAEDIRIATDETPPISRRTYEVLLGGWAEYRSKFTEDFLMGINVKLNIPVADFGYDTTQDPVVMFSDSSLNATSWHWDFDDQSATSTQQNPTHSFSSPGTYNVCLIASNGSDNDTMCKSITIHNEIPVAEWSADSTLMPTIAYTDLSTGSPVSWHWDFDDAGNDTSDLQNPTYTFTINGKHNVCLTVANNTHTSQPECKEIRIYGVGIEELGNSTQFLVYPNPFTDYGYIQVVSDKKFDDLNIEFYTISGKLVQPEISITNNRIKIETNGIASGNYIFKLFNGNKLIGQGKIVIQ